MSAETFYAGAGSAEILFPEEFFPAEGFCKVHDNPHIRVFLMKKGTRQIAIAAAELVMIDEVMVGEVRNLISEITGTETDRIWFHMTHAITTPHPVRDERKNELFKKALFQAVKTAASDAKDSLKPARLGVGTAQCEINNSRDIETPFGWWVTVNGTGPSNHTLTVIKAETEDAEPIGVIVSYGIKPCVTDNSMMKEGKREVSSDVTGVACSMAEEKLNVPVLFLMSAAGDQVPIRQALYDVVNEDGTVSQVDLGVQQGQKDAEALGKIMGQSILEAVSSISEKEAAEPDGIDARDGFFTWKLAKKNDGKPTKELTYIEDGETEYEVNTFRVGNIAFVGEKAEVNCVTEKELIEQSPYDTTIFVSMVNGGFKYMPDQESFDKITWEALRSGFMPGAAEELVKTAVELLEEMKRS